VLTRKSTIHCSGDDNEKEEEEEEDEARWDVARVAVPQPARSMSRVEMLKLQHMGGPPPLSPVHESPLEVCQIFEEIKSKE